MSAAIVHVACPVCASVASTSQAVLWLADGIPEHSYLQFPCGTCRQQVSRRVDQSMVAALQKAFPVKYLPLEMFEPHPAGPAINHDDLLDFHLALDSDEALAAVMAALTARYREAA